MNVLGAGYGKGDIGAVLGTGACKSNGEGHGSLYSPGTVGSSGIIVRDINLSVC